jgi:hypothetical protein
MESFWRKMNYTPFELHISGGEDVGNNQFIFLLVRNFSLERPRQRVLVPQWNLGLVLSALNLTPFEPAEEVYLKFLSYKCCFLFALASGRRRSEVHAFSTSNSWLRFSRDKSSVTLLTDPAFLGKNQIPDKGAEPIYIPALPQDSDSVSLCPVRILSIYLTRTASLRSSTNKRLFIPIRLRSDNTRPRFHWGTKSLCRGLSRLKLRTRRNMNSSRDSRSLPLYSGRSKTFHLK